MGAPREQGGAARAHRGSTRGSKGAVQERSRWELKLASSVSA